MNARANHRAHAYPAKSASHLTLVRSDTAPQPHRFSCGEYLRRRREAAGLTIVDVARTGRRAEADVTETVIMLGAFENNVLLASPSDLAQLRRVFFFDPQIYQTLAAKGTARLCRVCACSEMDPCDDEVHGGCAWAAEDLCTTCQATNRTVAPVDESAPRTA